MTGAPTVERRHQPPHPTRRPHDERAGPAQAAARVGRLVGEQLAVAAGQLGAGVGNLAFALVGARVLAPGAFAELAAFLALYLLIHVPAASLSAGSALTPELATRARRRVLLGGLAAGGALAVLSIPLAGLLDLSPPLLLAAAATAPAAGLLALDRGRLFALRRHRRLVASLLAEPAVRLSLGVALAAAAGPVGGAFAVVAAGYAALAVAHLSSTREADRPGANGEHPAAAGRLTANGDRPAAADRLRADDNRPAAADRLGANGDRPAAAAGADGRRGSGGRAAVQPVGAVVAFLLLAVVQNQDVLLANARLGSGEAGRFAVLSTLGGIAAFATTTVPLMLLPRAGGEGRDALRAALAVAGLLGVGAVAVVALSPERLVGVVFGHRYASAGALAVPYVLAMALLGVARVLVAHACAQGRARRAVALLVPVALLHAALIVVLGHDAAGVAVATLIATATLTAGSAALPLTISLDAVAAFARRRDVLVVTALAAGGLVLRLLATRGIWLDEATSIHDAQMPLGQMLDVMRSSDVHPPLHYLVLWLTVRLLGTGELAVRLPSLIADTALMPLLYVVARDLYDRRAGYAAAALGAVAPFAVWYAQEARMYALFMVFALLALWLQVRIVRDGGRTRDWIGYVLAAAALAYTQYFGLLFVGVQAIAFGVAVARGALGVRATLAWTVAFAVLIAPLVPFALEQFAANEAAGRGFQQPAQAGGAVEPGAAPGAYAALTNVAWAVLGYHSNATMKAIAALWPLGLLLALALLGRGRSWTTLLTVACALLPGVALFVLGQAKPFVFEVRYFIGAVPLALLLLARGLTSWARRPAVVGVACTIAVATLAAGLADQQLNGSNPRVYDFKDAVQRIESRARPGDVVVYAPKYLDTVIAYYGREGLHARPLGAELPKLRRGQRVFVLASFLDKRPYRQATQDAVRRLSRRYALVHRDRVPQIRTWEFRR